MRSIPANASIFTITAPACRCGAPTCHICAAYAPVWILKQLPDNANTRTSPRIRKPCRFRLQAFEPMSDFFCTKTAHYVYAQCVGHPPNTQQRGEPVTFFVVLRAPWLGNTMACMASRHFEKGPDAPYLQGFYGHRRVPRKITATKLRFVHACCIRTHMDYKRTTGSERLKPRKTVAWLPDWRFKCFAKDSFLAMQTTAKQQKKLSVRLHRNCEFATSTKPIATAS